VVLGAEQRIGSKEEQVKLFEPVTFRNLSLRNRIVWLPMVSWLGTEDGFVTDAVVERYRRRAEGGAGMVVVEATGVIPRKSPMLLRIYDDKYIPGLARLVDAVHKEGAKVSIQLIHFLRQSRSGYKEQPEDLSVDDIHQVVEDFVNAAARAKKAGFDAVELHLAHSYTLCSFISLLNKRQDEYGKSIAGRVRIVSEIMHGCREVLGRDYTIGCRFNAEDFVVGGNTLKQTRVIAKMLAEMGIDYINGSAGGKTEDGAWYTGYSSTRSMPPDYAPEAVNVYLFADLRQIVKPYGVPFIVAGRIPTAELAESLLQEDKADLIGLARPLLCDPDWPKKYMEGRPKDILKCIYCNECLDRDRRFEPVECTTAEKAAAKKAAAR